MVILGISAWYHDSAAAIIVDGQIIAAAQEERFSRKKHDARFPTEAVKYCLQEAGVTPAEIDAVAFYDKPLLKFERLIDTYYSFAPRGVLSFVKAMPIWLEEKLFLKRNIRKALKGIGSFDEKKLKLLFPEHHLSHAASTFYPSNFQSAAILVIDGVGEWATASIFKGDGSSISVFKEQHFPHSVGLLYSSFTYWLGFTVNSGEYKVMGLAPYGQANSENVIRYEKIIRTELVRIHDDGSVWINPRYFTYATGLRMVNDASWFNLFGFERRNGESKIEQHHCDLAMAIQHVTEEIVMKMALHALQITGQKNICLAGGVALNCVANGKLLASGKFENIYIAPASGDAGGALGAALAAWHIYYANARVVDNQKSGRLGTYLGPSFSDNQIGDFVTTRKAVASFIAGEQELVVMVAHFLASQKVVGWFQGRMEFGPRALGNRSILADPRDVEMQTRLNIKIKNRESFRPFAPSVIEEKVNDYFQLEGQSTFMQFAVPVQESIRMPAKSCNGNETMIERLKEKRSTLPAVTHVDFSARVQSFSLDSNSRFHKLISEFGRQTETFALVNTSFNVRGEPIVCSPADAYDCFINTDMDILVMGNYIFEKHKQDLNQIKSNVKQSFLLD